ncbi:hypothetical protein [Bacteroides cellulosilyticus]|jgi:hypothetical protein|uniref:hypothetical protein n=1 Tax=Bacteroides cellulosilyticus TaxID=246787 RepID=UPI0013ECA5BE|nr:hypothetical protein [Bacteroides cellulosilyticus]
MKDLKRNELVQEMDISEMKGANGGIGSLPLPIMPLEILQKAFDAIVNSEKVAS